METSLEPTPASESEALSCGIAPARHVADDAVGMPRWFVAIVNHNAEKSVAQRLEAAGYQAYVAAQTLVRISPSGRRRKVDKVMIPSHVFVRCTEAQRRIIVALPYINRFLADRARAKNGLAAPPAVIPPKEMDTLRFMLGQSDHPVTLSQAHYRPGDKVRVIRGALRGLQGEILHAPAGQRAPDSAEIIIRLDLLGTARVSLSPLDLSPIP